MAKRELHCRDEHQALPQRASFKVGDALEVELEDWSLGSVARDNVRH